jgi:hypothetical protein
MMGDAKVSLLAAAHSNGELFSYDQNQPEGNVTS